MCPCTRNRTPKRVRITPSDIANSRVLEPEVLRVYRSKEPVTSMKPKIKRPTYMLRAGKTHLHYRDIGHQTGMLWWVEGKRRFRTRVTTGVEYHHDLYRWADWRWRGRTQGEIATMMPPFRQYALAPETIIIPSWIVARLLSMGAAIIFADTAWGMRQVVRKG
jgi:hypothetical protein